MKAREGLVLGMSESEYHGQGVYREFRTAELSSTGAKKLLKSPAHYKWAMDHAEDEKPKATFDVGTAIHTKVLGTGQQAVCVPEELLDADGKGRRNAAAQKWMSEARRDGYVVVTASELQSINLAAEAVLRHPDVGPVLEAAGHPEASVFSQDPETGLPMRLRFDWMPTEHHVALDLKSTTDASTKAFTRTIDDLDYDVSWGHYMEGAAYAGSHITDMVFVAVEKVPPYGVQVHSLDRDWQEMAFVRARAARTILLRSLESGEWPCYVPGVRELQPPPWVINRFQDEMKQELEGEL